MENKRIIFCRIVWMNEYAGERSEDRCKWNGEYLDSWKYLASDATNFFVYNRKCYGYIPLRGKIRLERIDSKVSKSDVLDNVTVVWVANNPKGKLKIVGWYDNAKAYRHSRYIEDYNLQYVNGSIHYRFCAQAKDCHLIPAELRTFDVPQARSAGKGLGMGQSNIWYADSNEIRKVFLPKVFEYLDKTRDRERVHLYNELDSRDLENLADYHGESIEDLMEEAYIFEYWRDALEVSNLVMKLEQSYRTLMHRGRILDKFMYYDLAEDAFKKALAEKPDDFDACYCLFYLYYTTRRVKEAISFGERLKRISGDKDILWDEMDNLYSDSGDWDSSNWNITTIGAIMQDPVFYNKDRYKY